MMTLEAGYIPLSEWRLIRYIDESHGLIFRLLILYDTSLNRHSMLLYVFADKSSDK